MTTMDVKAISWVGGMCQKFEALCVEVEETVYQDSIKYVENQVKAVGTCVKRFYSDVMQDLLPLSSDDSLKLENSGVKLVRYADDGIYNTSDVDVKREEVKSEIGHLSRDSRPASQLDENVDNGLSPESYNSSSLCEESAAVNCLGFHVKQGGTEELCLCEDNKSEISAPYNVGSRLALPAKDGESTAGPGKMSDETAECLATSITSSSSNPVVWEEFGNDEDTARMSDAGSDEPVGDEFEIDDIDREAFHDSEQLSKMKLDESCVLVDKYEHFSVPHVEGKQRPYKKKMRDLLYLRRWSSSTNNASRETNDLHSSTSDSEWEIL